MNKEPGCPARSLECLMATSPKREVWARVYSLLPRDAQGVLPLSVTIGEAIQSRHQDLDPDHVRSILRKVTVATRYLKRLRAETWRFDLDGNPVERIQRFHREFADGFLEFRRARAMREGT